MLLANGSVTLDEFAMILASDNASQKIYILNRIISQSNENIIDIIDVMVMIKSYSQISSKRNIISIALFAFLEAILLDSFPRLCYLFSHSKSQLTKVDILQIVKSLGMGSSQLIKFFQLASVDDDPVVRAEAFRQFGQYEFSLEEVYNVIIKGLDDGNEIVRANAWTAIGKYQISLDEIPELLQRAFKDDNLGVRLNACQAVSLSNSIPVSCIEDLKGLFKIELSVDVKLNALQALRSFLPEQELIDMLFVVMAESEIDGQDCLERIKIEVIKIFKRYEVKEEYLPLMLEMLKKEINGDKLTGTGIEIIQIIGLLGEKAKSAAKIMRKLLEVCSPIVRAEICKSLFQIGEDPQIRLCELMELSTSDDLDVRIVATQKITDLCPEAMSAYKRLLDLINDGNSTVRVIAAAGLVKLGCKDKMVINELITFIKNGGINCSVIEGLGLLGSTVREVIPFLKEQQKEIGSFISCSPIRTERLSRIYKKAICNIEQETLF